MQYIPWDIYFQNQDQEITNLNFQATTMTIQLHAPYSSNLSYNKLTNILFKSIYINDEYGFFLSLCHDIKNNH